MRQQSADVNKGVDMHKEGESPTSARARKKKKKKKKRKKVKAKRDNAVGIGNPIFKTCSRFPLT